MALEVIGAGFGRTGTESMKQALEIHDGETWHSLVERIHELEVQMLPAAVRTLVEGRRLA